MSRRDPETIATYYARFTVKEDGSLFVHVQTGERAGEVLERLVREIAAGKLDPSRRDRETGSAAGEGILRDVFEFYTDGHVPRQRMSKGRARAMAAQLPARLGRELKNLARPAAGGGNTYGKTAKRLHHGLSDVSLAAFARACDAATPGASSPALVRQEISQRFGIPEGYGGSARDEALRRLVRKGREIDATT